MRHVLWIGGPPASGKTTIATKLARRHGLRLYSADTRTWDHRDRALAAGNAVAARWESLTPAQRWEQSTAAEMLEMSPHRERGAMVIDDLRALPCSPLVVAEGSSVPASAVSSGVAERTRAVWLLPTAEFQDQQLRRTGASRGQIALYRLLREQIAREAQEHDAPALTVDGSLGVLGVFDVVAGLFAEALTVGPRAEALDVRRTLLREINEARVAQVRGFYARPWADGDPDAKTQSFVCECGRSTCDVDLDLPVGLVADVPVLARGHGSQA